MNIFLNKLSFYSLSIFILLFIISCKNIPKNVLLNLDKAGKNKTELIKVLEHYKNDKEKLAAAYFLIGNMDEKYSILGDYSEYNKIYNFISPLKKDNPNHKELNKKINCKLDSLENIYGLINNKNSQKIYDLEFIKSELLIKNIDLAFKIWKEKPWCKNIDFNTFCNYILPYRVFNEPLSEFRDSFISKFDWLQDSLKNPNDIKEACLYINNYFANSFTFMECLEKLPLPTACEMYKFNAGECVKRYFLIVSIMRSLGIPVVIDFSYQWNHWAGNHSWVTLILNNGIIPFNAGEYYKEFPKNAKIPIGTGTSTTVFRKCYEKQKNVPYSIQESIYNIPENLRTSYIKNVSSEYNYPQTKLELIINKKIENQIVYLGSFGYSDNLIAIDFNTNNKANFSNIGKCGVYIPFIFKNNKKEYLSNPFIISCEDSPLLYLNPQKNNIIQITLTRKFPVQDSMLYYAASMINGEFQGSDNKDFTKYDILYTIKTPPYYFVNIPLTNGEKYKYIRYKAFDTSSNNIAEIGFYNKNTKINGKIISNFKTSGEQLFDDNIRTNYYSPTKTWIGLELNKKSRITRITYLPRNNFNIIEQGNLYELFYFDYGWHSLGIKKATTSSLNYNAPKNALYLLRNLTQGTEERIFTYNNNQLFW